MVNGLIHNASAQKMSIEWIEGDPIHAICPSCGLQSMAKDNYICPNCNPLGEVSDCEECTTNRINASRIGLLYQLKRTAQLGNVLFMVDR